ncbi:ankyrin repeat protein [Sphingomonas leidyi]|uniref:Ankyrin repeat protein n=1 Tax=Sphingomonas leidyi TaxID=68569 RepID=A0A7X5V255_9SPHN|nr:ankyrin repeat domain-containing protein [Sphingomonas leidyi]NIJ66413.1 ankyrin repeat protein [Sphingomonas leidyi]
MIPEAAVFTLIRSDAPAIETRITADDIRAKGDIGQTTLQEAIASRKPELAAWLVERGVDLDNRDRSGFTALHYAMEYQYYPLAEKLIRAGADVNATNKHGNGALWTAVMSARGDYALVDLLLAHGADPDTRNRAGKSPLDLAIDMGNAQLIEKLRHAGKAV